ncbi:hypothetical protein ABES80_01045 [Bacillus gobiensis]|uniref:hypothetical protein n=1 Tax=Bacillus gobiensis TaxID=1441095 RepID=UPI003D257350
MKNREINLLIAEKVEVTQAQATAIEEGIKCYEAQGLLKRGDRLYNLFGFEHWRVRNGKADPWEGLFAPLNSLTADDLMNALKKGYVVKVAAK